LHGASETQSPPAAERRQIPQTALAATCQGRSSRFALTLAGKMVKSSEIALYREGLIPKQMPPLEEENGPDWIRR
jgi:hypothetical protein